MSSDEAPSAPPMQQHQLPTASCLSGGTHRKGGVAVKPPGRVVCPAGSVFGPGDVHAQVACLAARFVVESRQRGAAGRGPGHTGCRAAACLAGEKWQAAASAHGGAAHRPPGGGGVVLAACLPAASGPQRALAGEAPLQAALGAMLWAAARCLACGCRPCACKLAAAAGALQRRTSSLMHTAPGPQPAVPRTHSLISMSQAGPSLLQGRAQC